jgi:hypothetical protein
MITIQMNDLVFYLGIVTPAVTAVFVGSLVVLNKIREDLPSIYKSLVHTLSHVAYLHGKVRFLFDVKSVRRIDLNTNIGKQLIVYDKVRRWCSVITCTVPATRTSSAKWFYENDKEYNISTEDAKHHKLYAFQD